MASNANSILPSASFLDGDGSRAVGIGGIMGGGETEIFLFYEKRSDRMRVV